MSNSEPNHDPSTTRTVRVERHSNAAAWWAIAVIAVVAIGVTGYIAANQNPSPTSQQLQAATDQGRAQAALDNAQSAQAAAAQSSAQAQQTLADQAAQSRAAAEAAANRSAMSADQAARDSSATVQGSGSGQSSAPSSDQGAGSGGQ